MGIKIEFNPDLALRNFKECEEGKRQPEECIPKDLKAGEVYSFLKSGHRNYWLTGEVPLLQTKGNEKLSRPLASIVILEATHFMEGDQPFTKGKYKVLEVFDDDDVHFDWMVKI